MSRCLSVLLFLALTYNKQVVNSLPQLTSKQPANNKYVDGYMDNSNVNRILKIQRDEKLLEANGQSSSFLPETDEPSELGSTGSIEDDQTQIFQELSPLNIPSFKPKIKNPENAQLCPVVIDRNPSFKLIRSASQVEKMFPWIDDPLPLDADTKVPCDDITRLSSLSKVMDKLYLPSCNYTLDHLLAVRTSSGNYRVKFDQQWNGIPVIDSNLVFVQEQTGLILEESIDGMFVRNIEKDISSPDPTLSPYDAVDEAVKIHGDHNLMRLGEIENLHSELVITLIDGQAKLVYIIDYYVPPAEEQTTVTENAVVTPPVVYTPTTASTKATSQPTTPCSWKKPTITTRKPEYPTQKTGQSNSYWRSSGYWRTGETGPNNSKYSHSSWWTSGTQGSQKNRESGGSGQGRYKRSDIDWRSKLVELLKKELDEERREAESDDGTVIIESMNGGARRPFTVVDAHTGQIYGRWDGLFSAFGRVKLKVGNPNEKVADSLEIITMNGDTCTYKYPLGKYSLWIKDRADPSGKSPTEFNCNQAAGENYDSTNGAKSPRNSAYRWGVATVKYLARISSKQFNRNLPIEVHHSGFVATWTGTSLILGDGNRGLFPSTTIDIVAHEIGHAFTELYSKLEANGQSAAMNEAFSDMTALALVNDVFKRDQFTIGETLFKFGSQVLRDICRPSQSQTPGHESAKQWRQDSLSHVASGVFSKAFCTLAKTTGWNVQLAYKVFLDANMLYWNRRSTFNQGACGVIKSAHDLRGNPGKQAAIQAFKSVDLTCSSV